MLEIKLVRKLKGKELVEDFEARYRSLENLKKALKRDKTNVKLHRILITGYIF